VTERKAWILGTRLKREAEHDGSEFDAIPPDLTAADFSLEPPRI
jgi:hypothetical protein